MKKSILLAELNLTQTTNSLKKIILVKILDSEKKIR